MSGHEAYMQKCLRFLSGRTPPETGLFDFLSLTPLDLQKISAATALLGLITGFVYFVWRAKIEDRRERALRVRQRLQILLGYINEYDALISPSIQPSRKAALPVEKRGELTRIFRLIQHFLEACDDLQFSEAELQALMKPHSVVDQSSLMRGKLADLPNNELRTAYLEALGEARRICLKKMS